MKVSSESYTDTIDRAAVLDRVGGDEELLVEITECFLTEAPVLLEDIRAAVQKGDAHRLERSAHSLKGSVANFGATATVQAAYRLESLGRAEKLEDAPAALRSLELHFEALTPVLQNLKLGR